MASYFLKIRNHIFYEVYTHIIKVICHSNKTYIQTSVYMLSVAMLETQKKLMKNIIFKISLLFFGAFN